MKRKTHTLGSASIATGVGKSTLSRALRDGIISATKNEKGAYEIDPAELHRVYPPVAPNSSENCSTEQNATPEKQADNTALLVAKLEMMVERMREKDERISELQEDRDEWRKQATRMLEDKRPRGFLDRVGELFKRSA